MKQKNLWKFILQLMVTLENRQNLDEVSFFLRPGLFYFENR